MRIHVTSNTGFGNGFFWYLNSEGHNTTVSSCNSTIPDCDVHILDNTTLSYYDSNKHSSAKVIGTCRWSSLVEDDATYKESIVKAIGYERPPSPSTTLYTISSLFNGQNFISSSISVLTTTIPLGKFSVSSPCSSFTSWFDEALVATHATPLLEQAKKFLRRASYHGAFTLTTALHSGKLYVQTLDLNLEHPTIMGLFYNTRRSKSDILLSLTNEASSPLQTVHKTVTGVELSVWPYPAPTSSTLIEGLIPENLRHFWGFDLAPSGTQWLTGATSGRLGYVLGGGDTVYEAFRRVRRTITNVKVPRLQFNEEFPRDSANALLALNGHPVT